MHRKKKKGRQVLVGALVLFLISLVAVCTKCWWLIIVNILLMYLLVAKLPVCHRRENVWLFVLTAISSVPINVKATWILLYYGLLSSGIPILGEILGVIQIYLLLFTVEEMVIGIVGRYIWKKQYGISTDF